MHIAVPIILVIAYTLCIFLVEWCLDHLESRKTTKDNKDNKDNKH